MLARKILFDILSRFRQGCLEIREGNAVHTFGDPEADLRASVLVHDPAFYRSAVLGGEIGFGESYMDGHWSSPDLPQVIRVAVRNLNALDSGSRLSAWCSRALNFVRHKLNANTLAGSRRNISAHYDLSNSFFRLFLDRAMQYSSAVYETGQETLDRAQRNKMDLICRKLDLRPGDRLLEIGTGWGGLALHAAENYGALVTTTTISREQYEYARDLFSQRGARIELLFEDYRHLRGSFDKIVSVEMFEAVGFRFYDEYFGALDRLLAPDGVALIQAITMNDQSFDSYRSSADWIQKYIFPGAELASVAGVMASLKRSTKLTLFHFEDIGLSYARTLAEWRQRFWNTISEVRALGFDERFIRMWDYYLAYCEGGFQERHISDVQMLLSKTHNRRLLYGESRLANRARQAELFEEVV
jgi:cyclopropane-fatty-acyl-phospholipid synthase